MFRKPLNTLLLKILGFIFVGVAIFGIINIVIGVKTFNDEFINTKLIVGLYSFTLSCIISIPCLVDGFRPNLEKRKASKKYIDNNSYANNNTSSDITETGDPEDISKTIKDIVIESIEQNTVKTSDGKKPIKYCIECGCAIDKNSNFCKICGKEQD